MTKHMVNFTKLGLRFHCNASLIKNAYCNCETPILFQLFKQNLATLFLEMGKKGQKTKKKNNNGYIYIIRIIINFIYNVCVPVLQKQAPSTVQLHISGSIHS